MSSTDLEIVRCACDAVRVKFCFRCWGVFRIRVLLLLLLLLLVLLLLRNPSVVSRRCPAGKFV